MNSVSLITLLSTTTDKCPVMDKTQGASANAYNPQSYQSIIMKQAIASDQKFDLDYTLAGDLPFKFGDSKCMYFAFDGWGTNKKTIP